METVYQIVPAGMRPLYLRRESRFSGRRLRTSRTRAGAPLCDRPVARAVHTDERRICAPSQSTASRRHAGRSSPSGTLSFTATAAWRPAGGVSRYGAVSKLFTFLGASLGSAVGWWLGARVGIMTAFIASMGGTGGGMYAGRRIAGLLLE